jgi:hypothetical protein
MVYSFCIKCWGSADYSVYFVSPCWIGERFNPDTLPSTLPSSLCFAGQVVTLIQSSLFTGQAPGEICSLPYWNTFVTLRFHPVHFVTGQAGHAVTFHGAGTWWNRPPSVTFHGAGTRWNRLTAFIFHGASGTGSNCFFLNSCNWWNWWFIPQISAPNSSFRARLRFVSHITRRSQKEIKSL